MHLAGVLLRTAQRVHLVVYHNSKPPLTALHFVFKHLMQQLTDCAARQ